MAGWLAAPLLAGCLEVPLPEPEAGAFSDATAARSDALDAGRPDVPRETDGGCSPCVSVAESSAPAHDSPLPVHDASSAPARNAAPAHDAAAALAAASDAATDPLGAPTTKEGGTALNVRPVGVADCYSAASAGHPASQRHWQVMGSGDLSARGSMIAELKRAAAEQPREEEFALLLGLASLWRAAEGDGLEDGLLALDSLATAETELTRAYALCPSDYRITSWLGSLKVRMGRLLDDPAQIDKGVALMDEGIAHYPEFVTFTKLLVYADAPPDDPTFKEALAVVDSYKELVIACKKTRYPACINTPKTPHNLQGGAIFAGDLYARAQDRARALEAYMAAKIAPDWASWKYQDALEERIRTLDARMAAAASASAFDDFETAWNSAQLVCSSCHRN
jgi:hypothetical protein